MTGARLPAPRPRHLDPALAGILVAALLARWLAARVLDGDLLSRTWEYERVALNLLNGTGFVAEELGTPYRALIHPLYPSLCAAVYWLVGHSSLTAMQALQAAAVVPAGWCAFQLGSAFSGRAAGLAAAAGVTLHPALLVMSLRRHALWLDAVLFLVALWATYRARSATRPAQSAALGILFGVGMLSRATVGVFMLAACGWLVWQWRRHVRESMGHVALIVGAAFLVAAPWLVRNAVVLGRPVGFITPTSWALWIGNNPAATGGALAADGRSMHLTAPALLERIAGRTELEQQAAFQTEAVTFITDNPGTTAVNYVRKLRSFAFWSAQSGAWYPGWFRPVYLTFYLVLLTCGVVGAVRLVRRGLAPEVVLCVGLVLSVGLVQSVFFVEGRHRWEVESALVVLAACALPSGRRQTHQE